MGKNLFGACNCVILFFCLCAFGVEVKSDLTSDEEGELSLDESVTKAESKRLDLITEKIALLVRANDLDAAALLFRKLTSSYEDQDNLTTSRMEKAGFSIACAYIKAKKSDSALKFTDDLLKLTRDNAISFYIKALALEGVNKPDDAAKWKEKAVALDADDEEYRFDIGQFFFTQKEYTIAEAEFRKVIELNSKDANKNGEWFANAQLFLGRIAYDKREYQEAVKRYGDLAATLQSQNLLNALPGIRLEIVSAHLNAAREYEIKGEFDKELEVLQSAEKFFPDIGSLTNAIAAALSHLKKYDEAKARYERLMQFAPDYPDPLVGYGDVLMNLGQKDEAEVQFKKAIEIYTKGFDEAGADKEDIATNLNNLAWFYATHKRNLDEGIKLSKRSLELRPDEAAYMDTLAELLFQNGQKDEAIKYIKQAIEKNPVHLLYYQQQLAKFEGKAADKNDSPK